jgi:hypothetical protein
MRLGIWMRKKRKKMLNKSKEYVFPVDQAYILYNCCRTKSLIGYAVQTVTHRKLGSWSVKMATSLHGTRLYE